MNDESFLIAHEVGRIEQENEQLQAEVDRLTKRCEEAQKFLEEHSHSWDCCRCIVCGHFEEWNEEQKCRVKKHHEGCELQKWLEGKP